jgi:hypothetical protein
MHAKESEGPPNQLRKAAFSRSGKQVSDSLVTRTALLKERPGSFSSMVEF